MTTVAMNNLWSYIQGLNLSTRNRNWLAQRLINAEVKPRTKSKRLSKEIEAIPEEYRCDPYEISPSGDPYFADKRNVEALNKAIKEAHEHPEDVVSFSTMEEMHKYFDSL